MAAYLERRESIRYWMGDDDRGMLTTLANRYVGANPEVPFAYRAFSESGILQMEDGLFDLDLSWRLTDAKQDDYVYALGRVWSDDERSIDSAMMPLGPIRLYVNETLLYRSVVVDEMKPDARVVIPLLLRKGWNTIVIEARKTRSGFGCRFGAEEAKVRILHVLSPFEGRSGAAGWIYSEPTKERRFGENGLFPDFDSLEEESGLGWLPASKHSQEDLVKPNCERLFGLPRQPAAAYAWSKLETTSPVERAVWEVKAFGPTTVWLDGVPIIETDEGGAFRVEKSITAGEGSVLVRTVSRSGGWGFELDVTLSSGKVAFQLPVIVHGASGPWLYAGPLSQDVELEPSEVQSMKRLFDRVDEDGRPIGQTYWYLDGPRQRVRPYYENAMLSNKWTTGSATNYGRWDYPLGVTMYGLLRTAKALGRLDIEQYANRHISACTDMYAYSLWDRKQYGFPSVNHQLVLMKMLDNCGSFGSAMLEGYLTGGNADANSARIAEMIADFILNRLERREDGAYYRLCEGEYSADTLWADDLYMSTPFLMRYFKLTGDRRYADDAAKQFLLFKDYLFIPEHSVMSHVFDFKYGEATRIPWGRGNGWCLFSLSELLESLPEDHADRPALLAFFREMCTGVAGLQSESGLWHQVLTHPDAYEEASCTAMFAYAFARGVRFGWLEDSGKFTLAAQRAWQGLTQEAIDRQGNVHGVCSGSRYAFTADYYKYDLLTVVNDNHGIGIMMLAGVEMDLLEKHLQNV
ncbi:glycoside hydrolase family 105 protein [Paenibacillus sp. R14(2021)]|uniref:glycoside hydrolase family 88/105 protein n=1 Tax=Paenibacillus sp. R14(2021) TaxID=2859228 RepID=UPI001C612CDB|nr:glycoside hydrolase family 88 protein [Paenibacillus sp. R14(2021)]